MYPLLPQSRTHQPQQHRRSENTVSALKSALFSASASADAVDEDTSLDQSNSRAGHVIVDFHDCPTDANSALVTPIKASYLQLKQGRQKQQTQLKLVAVKNKGTGGSNHATGKIIFKNKLKSGEGKKLAAEKVKQGQQSIASSVKWPPISSVKSLPPLAGRMVDLMKKSDGDFTRRNNIDFEVNQECTSIAIVPSGRLAIAGFTDGTIRLFDLTGTFFRDKKDPCIPSSSDSFNFDDDASDASSEREIETASSRRNTGVVDSHINQRFGAVACQIHAKGVHTSLLMDVAVSEDGMYAFGGVLRGSVELVAIYLGEVENYLDRIDSKQDHNSIGASVGAENESSQRILDLVTVVRYADAKLKGFGAVARLWNGWERARTGERPEYLLLTGKGIKNIHIWSFKPSCLETGDDPVWACLYDTQTNGTSISQLYFRHHPQGLQAISKSDDQKLRVWDLSWEQERVANRLDGRSRPKRPNYVDVTSTEKTVGVCGTYAFALSAASEAIINLIPLDAEDVSSPFNVTELALPTSDAIVNNIITNKTLSRTGRQQRGELKTVVNVCGLGFDASHALLSMSDGSVVHFSHDETGHPVLVPWSSSLFKTSVGLESQCAPFGSSLALCQNKKMCLARVGSEGLVVVAVSSYNESVSRGSLILRALHVGPRDTISNKIRKFWGFNGLKRKRKLTLASSKLIILDKSMGEDILPTSPSVEVIQLQNTKGPLVRWDKRTTENTIIMSSPEKTLVETSLTVGAAVTLKPTEPFGNSGAVNDSPIMCDPPPNDLFVEPESIDHQFVSIVDRYIVKTVDLPENEIAKENNDAINSQQNLIYQTKEGNVQDHVAKKRKTSSMEVESSSVVVQTAHKSMPSTDKASFPDGSFQQEATVVQLTKEKETQMGHLGVTLFQMKFLSDLPKSCYQQKERPILLVERCPKGAINERLANSDAPKLLTPNEFIAAPSNTIMSKHSGEQERLARKHRAEHEMLRRQVLNTIRCVISTWDIEVDSSENYNSIVDSAKKWFDDALADHQETLDDMLCQQVLEAEALAARQTLELVERRAPIMQVSFPFPEVFQQAKKELFTHFGFNKNINNC